MEQLEGGSKGESSYMNSWKSQRGASHREKGASNLKENKRLERMLKGKLLLKGASAAWKRNIDKTAVYPEGGQNWNRAASLKKKQAKFKSRGSRTG